MIPLASEFELSPETIERLIKEWSKPNLVLEAFMKKKPEKWVPVCGFCSTIDEERSPHEQVMRKWRRATQNYGRNSCVLKISAYCDKHNNPIGEAILKADVKKHGRKKTAKKKTAKVSKPKPQDIYPPWPKAD